jgi:lysozyme
MATVSPNGLNLIKSFEGCRLQAYLDASTPPVWTIGYGHTGPDVHDGLTITQEQADQLLAQDVDAFAEGVENCLIRPVDQNQFDALVSLAYNVGLTAFKRSTLLQLVNAGNDAAAAAQFGLWVHAGANVLPGLVRRRAAEAALFQTTA